MTFKAPLSLAALLPVLISAPSVAVMAEQNIRILPDQAALACQARAQHELEAQGGEAMALKRFNTEAMENFMQRVKGQFEFVLNGETRDVDVVCDVSSSKGVEVFTMEIMPQS